jgi:hypothetical protein
VRAITGFDGDAVGLKPLRSHSKSRGGTHHVAPKAASELIAQVEAKFYMYCFVLH